MNFFQHILSPTLMRHDPKLSVIQRLPYLQHTADVFNNIFEVFSEMLQWLSAITQNKKNTFSI